MVYPKKVDTNRVKTLREEGLTMDQIADKLEVSKTTIWRHLGGETQTSITKVTISQEKIKFFHYAWFLAKNSARPTEARAIKELMELKGIELDEELAKRIYWEMKENRKNNHNNHKKGGV